MTDVVFDLDGTLVDSLPGIAWSIDAALAECGLPPRTAGRTDDLKALIGPPVRAILAAVTGLADGLELDRLLAAFRRSYDADGWRRTVLQPGALNTIERLREAGIRQWIVTNKPSFSTGLILEHLEIARFFEDVVCRDSRRPAFESKAEMLLSLQLPAATTIMVGDTAEDLHAAVAAGMECLLVPHGYGTDLPVPTSGWEKLLAACYPNNA